MPPRTQQQRPTTSGRFARSGGRPQANSGSARFARSGSPSPYRGRPARPARPNPSRKPSSGGGSPLSKLPFVGGGSSSKKSSSSGPGKLISGLSGALGSSAKKGRGSSSGGGKGKSVGGVAALAGLAGLALKNRDKLPGKFGGGSGQTDPQATSTTTHDPAVPATTVPPTTSL